MNHSRLTAAVFFLAEALSLHAANWEMWRGQNNSGMAAGTAPTTWSADQNVNWTAEIPGLGHSTPLVWEDRIFVTTAVPTESLATVAERNAQIARQEGAESGRGRARGRRAGRNAGTAAGAEHRFLVIAFDRETGRKVWERNPITARPHEGYHRRYGSFASPSPVTDGERLFVPFGSRGLYAYDLEGNLLWEKDYGVRMQMAGRFGEGRSPALNGGTLLTVFDHQGQSFVSALDKRTGKEVWRRDRDERSSWSLPLITEFGGRTQAIVSASGKIRSYDLETGEVIWECAGLGSNVIPAVVRDRDMVYAMSGHRDPNLLAIRLGGEGDITDSDHVIWTNQRGNSYTASAVLNEGILYVVTDRGLISAFDATTGEPHYRQQRLPNPYSLKASPIGADGKLYVATEQGDVVVVKLGPTYEVLAVNSIEGETFISSPVIADGEIYLRGRNTLYAVSD